MDGSRPPFGLWSNKTYYYYYYLSERLGLRSIDASSPHIGLAEGHRQQNLQSKKESTCEFIKVGGVKVSKEIREDQFVPNLKRG